MTLLGYAVHQPVAHAIEQVNDLANASAFIRAFRRGSSSTPTDWRRRE